MTPRGTISWSNSGLGETQRQTRSRTNSKKSTIGGSLIRTNISQPKSQVGQWIGDTSTLSSDRLTVLSGVSRTALPVKSGLTGTYKGLDRKRVSDSWTVANVAASVWKESFQNRTESMVTQ